MATATGPERAAHPGHACVPLSENLAAEDVRLDDQALRDLEIVSL